MLVATWFGCGLSRYAPGTCGSLIAMPFAWALLTIGGAFWLLIASAILFLLGWWVSAVLVSTTDQKDPQFIVIDEVVGQIHVTRTLQNAIGLDRVAHGYIFSGPRGVGKTTSARILAKILNCESYNYGLSATGTDQQLLTFRKFSENVEADLVILFITIHNIERIKVKYWESFERTTGKFVLVPKPYFTLSKQNELELSHVPVPMERKPADHKSKEDFIAPFTGGNRYLDPLHTFSKLKKAVAPITSKLNLGISSFSISFKCIFSVTTYVPWIFIIVHRIVFTCSCCTTN